MSEVDVGGLAVEDEISCQCSITSYSHETAGNRGAVSQNSVRLLTGSACKTKECCGIPQHGKNASTDTHPYWLTSETKQWMHASQVAGGTYQQQ